MEFPCTIAYNMEDKKVGCVLLQPILGSSIESGVVPANFDTESWDLSPTKLKLYVLNSQEEFDKVVAITKNARKK